MPGCSHSFCRWAFWHARMLMLGAAGRAPILGLYEKEGRHPRSPPGRRPIPGGGMRRWEDVISGAACGCARIPGPASVPFAIRPARAGSTLCRNSWHHRTCRRKTPSGTFLRTTTDLQTGADLGSQIAISNAQPGTRTALPAFQGIGLKRGRGCAPSGRGMAQRGAVGGLRFGLPLAGGGRMPRGATAASAGADARQPWGRTLAPRRPPSRGERAKGSEVR